MSGRGQLVTMEQRHATKKEMSHDFPPIVVPKYKWQKIYCISCLLSHTWFVWLFKHLGNNGIDNW